LATLDELKQAVITGATASAAALTQALLNEGHTAQAILDEALIPGMDVVGERFGRQEFFIPEMLIASRAMKAAMEPIKPLLAGRSESRGKAVLGTVAGDLHDIGKELVAIALRGGGFVVVDLGVDVPPDAFVTAVQAEHPDLLVMSAMLTTTMAKMKETIDALSARGLRNRVKVGVGGAPLSQGYADEIGADFYAKDAPLVVTRAKELLGNSSPGAGL